jgi:hypothetical protein
MIHSETSLYRILGNPKVMKHTTRSVRRPLLTGTHLPPRLKCNHGPIFAISSLTPCALVARVN